MIKDELQIIWSNIERLEKLIMSGKENEKTLSNDEIKFDSWKTMEIAFDKEGKRKTIVNHAKRILAPALYKAYFLKKSVGEGKNKFVMPMHIFQNVYESLHGHTKGESNG